MNILLLCNNKNLLGNKLVIYSTLYCNDTVNWFIVLTEEIGEKEETNLQNLVTYMDSSSIVIFERINKIQSLEEQYSYLSEFLYIAPDCMTIQNLEKWYQKAQSNSATVLLNDTKERTCVAFIDLQSHRLNNISTYIDYDDNGISSFFWNEDIPIDYFDSRIGYSGQFSFYFNVPIIFWFANENKSIYSMKLDQWKQLYPDFEPDVKQIQLAEQIYF